MIKSNLFGDPLTFSLADLKIYNFPVKYTQNTKYIL